MRRLILAVLALLSVLALPAAAHAGPVKIGPRASAVSPAGVTTIEAANSSRHVLRFDWADVARSTASLYEDLQPRSVRL